MEPIILSHLIGAFLLVPYQKGAKENGTSCRFPLSAENRLRAAERETAP
jgi:hypothetical protein